MKPRTNYRGDGRGASHRPVPAVPNPDDEIADAMRDPGGERVRRESQRLAEAGRQRAILEGLFSDDPRRQFAALRRLEAIPSITAAQHERIRELRQESPHLLIAEQAEKLLQEKPHDAQEAISEQTRREVASLIRAQEERQRRRHAKAASANSAVYLSVASLIGWGTCALALGCLLGGLTTYVMLPRQAVVREKSAEVHIDPRSGNLLCVDEASGDETSDRAASSGYYPAYYCWKCQQWLPVRRPQKPGESIAGPRQSLVERPMVPKDDRIRNRP